ncbi:MAG: OmpA family protein [Acidobacteria bacterium]|nr:OmpA family protein [Acidobacteriota bacterium]
MDRKDKCPDTPSGARVDAVGCPSDGDGDGVFDGLDKCPDTTKGWPVDASGCTPDADGDGVVDPLDKCPNTPRGTKVDANGCPVDSDGDGVTDDKDRCPGTARGVKVDANGCPLDSDGDGVTDDKDRCPDTPRGTKVDANGCPEQKKEAPLFTPEKRTLVLEGVYFDTDKATLKPESVTVLDRVAASLRDWPEVRVEVGGHTDSRGSNSHNQKLSEARAQAVRDYLVDKGIDASRITAKGYGEGSPIDNNNTEEGRQKNRRVELKSLD